MDLPTHTEEISSPRDISGSLPRVEEEIPSRSYYSSHIHIEPGKCKKNKIKYNNLTFLKKNC